MITKTISIILSAIIFFTGISVTTNYSGKKSINESELNITNENDSYNLVLDLNSRISSAEDLKWYKSNSEKNIQVVLKYYENKEVPLTVTLSRPITVEEFESLVSIQSKLIHLK